MNATKTSKIQVEIRQHPRSPETHKRAIVTTARGRCYFCDWAEPWPNEDAVRQAWTETRSDFQPYRGF